MCVFVMKYPYIKYETKLFYFACMSVIIISEKQYNSNVHFLFSNFPVVSYRSKTAPRIQFLDVGGFVCSVCFVIVPHLSFSWCLRKVVLRDSGISWISSFNFSVILFYH